MAINLDNKLIVWLLEKRWRLIAAGCLAVVAPLIALSMYVYAQVTSEVGKFVLAENETFLNMAAYSLEERVATDISISKILAERPLLIAALKANDIFAIEGHLKSFIVNSLSIERVLVTTPRGMEIAAYPADPAGNGRDLSDKDWYRGVSRDWTPYVSDFFLRPIEPQRYLFAIATPVKDLDGNVVGILVLHPKTDYFRELDEIRIGSGFVYVVDKNGHLIYHPEYKLDRIYDFSGMPAVGKVKEGRAGIETSIDPVTKDVLVSAYRPVKWGWGMVMQRPEREAVQPVKKVVSGLLVFTVISMFVGLFIAYYAMQLLYSIRALALRVLEQERLERETNEKLQAELAERKLAEQRLELTLQELARSNKELEQFAYVASHDLQEPLRKVGSFTELLEKRYREKMGPDADRYIGYIVDGAKRMSQLISDLLTLSRIGSVPAKFAMTDCNVVLRRVLDDLQHRIRESNAEVSADQLPTILADESLMGLVFQNLISNALKFRGDRTPLIHVSARREGAAWVFAVSDNGIGIEPEYFDRIFLMFQRLHTKAEYPGTGIGLAICRKVIERHGGRIWLASEFGKGTTFYFTLPDGRKEVTKHDPDEER